MYRNLEVSKQRMLRDKLYATIKTESLLNIVGNLVVLVAKLSQEKSGQMHPCTVINFACTVNTFHNDLLVGSECDKYFSMSQVPKE